MEDVAIKAENVSKVFKLPHEKNTSLKSTFVNFYRQRRTFEKQQALKDISFEIKKGEFFGIVGRNGSGKSTLLKLLAGIYNPTKGSIQVNGKLTPFIELGVGFNPELTGRENVYLNGALLGFSRKEMTAMYKDIVEFAELEKFMDQKLKNYSSGMQVRLAFSIAIRAQSDILLIDEVLAVGDAAFQTKCFEYFRILKQQRKTVVFVSHDRGAIESFCDRCILIDNGALIAEGSVAEVLKAYNAITLEQMASALQDKKLSTKKRWGNKNIEITNAHLLKDNKKITKLLPYDRAKLVVNMKSNETVQNPIYGITMYRKGEAPVFVTNTKVEKIPTGTLKSGDELEIIYEFENIFGNGSYIIAPAVANSDGTVFYDWREDLIEVQITGWDDTYISIHPKHNIKLLAKES